MPKPRNRGQSVLPAQKTFLNKWKVRAMERRDRLREALAKFPEDPAKAETRRVWLQRTNKVMASRREWLEARLEHVSDLEAILQGAIEGFESQSEYARTEREYPPEDNVEDAETEEYPPPLK